MIKGLGVNGLMDSRRWGIKGFRDLWFWDLGIMGYGINYESRVMGYDFRGKGIDLLTTLQIYGLGSLHR